MSDLDRIKLCINRGNILSKSDVRSWGKQKVTKSYEGRWSKKPKHFTSYVDVLPIEIQISRYVGTRTTDTQRENSLHCTAENSLPLPNCMVWRQHILSATSAQFFRYL